MRRGTTIGYLRQDINHTSSRRLLEEVVQSSPNIKKLEHKVQMLQEDLAEEKDEENIWDPIQQEYKDHYDSGPDGRAQRERLYQTYGPAV